ncbi:hypothetical protein EYC80_005836 [Monilinia laxa]|uniref:Uncharacterized protein n=1 Tax=Monilinia laxa TaxID=61186 RepID=A0A5N6KFF5_MONLA|nr:hypothetical protein EYC80_005836 [Monilinia laxa]
MNQRSNCLNDTGLPLTARGSILNIGPLASRTGLPNAGPYAMEKHALGSMFEIPKSHNTRANQARPLKKQTRPTPYFPPFHRTAHKYF